MFSYDGLTSPERELWDAFPQGRRVDLRTGVAADDRAAGGVRWGPGRTVRAAVVVALLLGANAAQPGAVAGLRLAGARLTGRLDLAGAEVGHALWLEDCWFEEAVDLLGASTRTLVITGSRIPGVEAYAARIEGTLDLRRSEVERLGSSPFNHVSTALSLSDARVTGGLLLDGAEISAPGGWAVAAGGLVMEGGLTCRGGFAVRGKCGCRGRSCRADCSCEGPSC
ncbi:hypothetical protein [Streptomyces sp. CS159]|uniref:hypothetical protein n=1 Tax=Streptomyces sp. CS159 TaxID=1982762 RepID=UPI00211B146D|nr:hypothetical protein [Streptomyces sp. CS159]